MAFWNRKKKQEKEGPSKVVQMRRLRDFDKDLKLTETELAKYTELKRRVADFRRELSFVRSHSPMFKSVNRSGERTAHLGERAHSLFREVMQLERFQQKLRTLKNEELVDFMVGLKGRVLPGLKAKFRRELRVENWIEEGTFTLERLLRRAVTMFRIRSDVTRPNVRPLDRFFSGVEDLIDREIGEISLKVVDIKDLEQSIGKAA